MKLFLQKILLFFGMFFSLLFTMYIVVSLSTKKTNMLELITFGNNYEWGSNYQRSFDFKKWINNKPTNHKSGLIIGSSTAYRNINPMILTQQTDVDWFNVGSSSQSMDVSLVLLKYALKKRPIDYVILDLYSCIWNEEYIETRYDWVKNGIGTIDMYPQLVFQNTSLKLINQALYRSIKSALDGKDYVNSDNFNGTYLGKGFVCSNKVTPLKQPLDTSSRFIIDYENPLLQKIVSVCKENNIRLILNISPVLGEVYETKNFTASQNIYFLQNDYFSQHNQFHLFYDSHHLTCEGSKIYSDSLSVKLKKIVD